ncbi:MAG: nitroreductase family protein [Desulforhopalus sp.]
MEFFEVVNTRRSIRSFTDDPVSEEIVERVLRAAMSAPSAGNQQPWHFVIVRDRKNLEQIPRFHPYAKMVEKCHVAVIVCGDPGGKKWPAFWTQDCSAATQNMLLAARALGLGTVWAGIFPEESRMAGFRKLFGIPDNIFPFAIVPMGWPTGEFKEKERYNPTRVRREVW